MFAQEPLPVDNSLRSLPNVVLTPHLGHNVREFYEVAYAETVENIAAFMSGKPIRLLTAQRNERQFVGALMRCSTPLDGRFAAPLFPPRRRRALVYRSGVAPLHVALIALLAGFSGAPSAQTYPSKPIRLLVGFPAGGSSDASARAVANRMGQALGATIVIENRGGAGGSIAAQIAARAAADGYTLLWSSPGALTISQILEKSLPYNPQTAFAPIGLAFTFCNALVARPDAPVSTVGQLIALAKAKPGHLNYGSQGIGSAGHLSGQLLQNMTGASFTHIPYKGGNDILAALLGGELQLSFASSTTARGMRSRMKILAVTSLARDPSLPDVPSMNEAGVKGYDASFWFGLLAPAGTPLAIVNRLNRQLRETLAEPALTQPLQEQGLNPAPSSPQEYAARIRADYVKWEKVIGGT